MSLKISPKEAILKICTDGNWRIQPTHDGIEYRYYISDKNDVRERDLFEVISLESALNSINIFPHKLGGNSYCSKEYFMIEGKELQKALQFLNWEENHQDEIRSILNKTLPEPPNIKTGPQIKRPAKLDIA